MNEANRLNFRFATIAFFASIPFVLFAAEFTSSGDQEGLLFFGGYMIFMLGMPLTKLPELFGYGPIFGPGSLWVLTEAVLFVIQWVIWSQLIVIVCRRMMKKG